MRKNKKENPKWTKEELLKACFFDFLKQEREFDGPFEFDEELGEDVIAWYSEDFDENGNLREGMKDWEWVLNGEDGPDDDTVLARDEERHWVVAPRSECVWDGNEWICKED